LWPQPPPHRYVPSSEPFNLRPNAHADPGPGNYANQIEAAIEKAHTDHAHLLDTLFYCFEDGNIQVIKDCGSGRCADGGAKNSDICLPSSRIHLILEKEEAGESLSVKDQWEEEEW
jgi:hypothetical protein